MAKMYPPEPAEDTKSSAERKIFSLLKSELGDDWIVLHSLGLVWHRTKPWAELDFVLIGSPGVFCLEVKGGRVARKEGLWRFTDRDGRSSPPKHQGPFEQVGGGSAALRGHLVERLPQFKQVVVGYGVVMPDIEFREHGPDIEPAVLHDLRDAAQPFGRYMQRLEDYWHERLMDQHGRAAQGMSDADRRLVLEEFRGDFDLRPSLRTRVGRAKDELLRLTIEQYSVLDGLMYNERVIVRGGAGAGKTLLAVEEARRHTLNGKRVFFCCYNRMLAAFVREVMRDQSRVEVWHLHGFMANIVSQADLKSKLPNAEEIDLFEVYYPELCVEGLMQLGRLQEYDVLIVDEAQDLLRSPYIDVFDALVRNGLQRGSWRFFLDPNQDIFGGISTDGLPKLLNAQPAQFKLSINCRNTAPIAIVSSLLSGVEATETLVVAGPEVEFHWYRDSQQEQREISKCINRLVSDGIDFSEIVVLSRRRLANSSLNSGLTNSPYSLTETEQSATGTSRTKQIRFSTIGAFKGLEADAVLLIDVDTLTELDLLASIYVGASRARAILAVFIDERQKKAYEERAFEFGSRLSSTARTNY